LNNIELKNILLPNQRVVANWAFNNHKGIVCDNPLTGKSLSLLAAVSALNCYPLIIVCLNHKVEFWENLIAKIPKKPFETIQVFSYHDIERYSNIIKVSSAVIFDDMDLIPTQYLIKADYESEAADYNQNFSFSRYFDKFEFIWGIVSSIRFATPKDRMDLWALFELVKVHSLLGCRDRKRYGVKFIGCKSPRSFESPDLLTNDKEFLKVFNDIVNRQLSHPLDNISIVKGNSDLLHTLKKRHQNILIVSNGLDKNALGIDSHDIQVLGDHITDEALKNALESNTGLFVFDGDHNRLPNEFFDAIIIGNGDLSWPRHNGNTHWYICSNGSLKRLDKQQLDKINKIDDIQKILDYLDSLGFDDFFWFMVARWLHDNCCEAEMVTLFKEEFLKRFTLL